MHKKRGILFLLIIVLIVSTLVSAEEVDKCKNVKYKALCYTLAAQSEKDKDICEKIPEKEMREECEDSASRTNPIYYISPIIILGLLVYFIRNRT